MWELADKFISLTANEFRRSSVSRTLLWREKSSI
jgi:hypothetical protein